MQQLCLACLRLAAVFLPLGLQSQASTTAQVTCRNLSAPDCTRLRAERLAPPKRFPTADGTAAVVLMSNARLLHADDEIAWFAKRPCYGIKQWMSQP